MPEYRRNFIEGGTYFFTVITFQRKPIFSSLSARTLLRNAWKDVRERFPFSTDAVCLLPDHLHCIWALPEGDSNFSLRWKEIKRLFTRSYLEQIGPGEVRSQSREKRGIAAIWQRRFWEHTIRDENDLARHIDYIHFNPIKHGLVEDAADWSWSSFHRFVRAGYYPGNWRKAIEDSVKELVCGE